MPLRFMGVELTKQEVLEMYLPAIKDENGNETFGRVKVRDLVPRGKNKTVIFQWLNYQPYQVLGKKGMQTPPMSKGGERSIVAFDTVTLENWKDKSGATYENIEGVLQYYETAQKFPNGREAMAPDRVYFLRGATAMDAEKDWAKFFFFLVHSRNVRSSAWSRKKPDFKLVEVKDVKKKQTAAVSLYVKAIQAIDDSVRSPKLFKNLYEACNFTDWDMYVSANHKPDYESLKAPLYALAQQNPQGMLDKINDASLDISAKVTQALEAKVLKYEAGKWFWGDNTKTGQTMANANDKLIANTPKGKTANMEIAKAWFVEWLKGEPETMSELNVEMDLAPAVE